MRSYDISGGAYGDDVREISVVFIIVLPLPQPPLTYDARRPFLDPRVKALRLIASILLGLVGDVGLPVDSLPDRALCELSDDCDVDLLRLSSARISSRETLRWGWVMGTSSRFSTKREDIAIVVVGRDVEKVWMLVGTVELLEDL